MADKLEVDQNPRPVMERVQSHFASRGKFVPVVGGHLIVHLPEEQVRATVESLTTRDIVIVKLSGTIFNGRFHGHKTNDILACQRAVQDTGVGELGAEVWVPITEGAVEQREAAERKAAQAAAIGAEPEFPEE